MPRASQVLSGRVVARGRTPAILAAATIAVLAVAGLYFLRPGQHRVAARKPLPIRQEPPPVGQAPVKASLGLKIENQGAAVKLSWNSASGQILNASQGMMIIWSQGDLHNLTLTADELRSGSLLYKPASGKMEFQLAVLNGEEVAQESVVAVIPERVAVIPERNDAPPAIPSRKSVRRAKHPLLRAFSPPALLPGPKPAVTVNLDPAPVVLQAQADHNEVASLFGQPSPPPATGDASRETGVGKLQAKTYAGTVVDAACATRAGTAEGLPDGRCGVSPSTELFALRLKDGHILRFDSVGNDRVQNTKKRNAWVATSSSGKPVHAKVSGAVLGDKLIVLSIR